MTAPRPSVSKRVVEAVAEKADTTPLDLEPLYHTIDPELLDGLFTDHAPSRSHSINYVEFRYAGYRVTVSQDGSLDVSPAVGEGAPSPDDAAAHHPSGDPNAPD